SSGVIIRMPSDSISLFSRTSKGVRVMRVGEGDSLVTATTAEREEESAEVQDGEASQETEETKEETTQE
ncbi:MAG: hypothetical protein IJN38_03765, partial [Clostridia bacterium]|nr:hypothetical protein [Clostridia bacterium]